MGLKLTGVRPSEDHHEQFRTKYHVTSVNSDRINFMCWIPRRHGDLDAIKIGVIHRLESLLGRGRLHVTVSLPANERYYLTKVYDATNKFMGDLKIEIVKS